MVWSISHRDLEAGLGKVSKILVPLLFIIMIIIVISSLMLPGASIGLSELYQPDWSSLFDFRIWLGGLVDLYYGETTASLISMVITLAVLVISTIVFTRLPAKNPEWEESAERF